MFTTKILPAEVQMFWVVKYRGTGKRISRTRSVVRRATELVNGQESFLALINRGVLATLDASFKFTRASGEPWSTVRNRELSGVSMSLPQWF